MTSPPPVGGSSPDPELEDLLFGPAAAAPGGGPPPPPTMAIQAAPAPQPSPDPELEHLLFGPLSPPGTHQPVMSARDQARTYSVPLADWSGIEEAFSLPRVPVDWLAEKLSGGKFQGPGAAGHALSSAITALRNSPLGFGVTGPTGGIPEEVFAELDQKHPALGKILGAVRGAEEGVTEVAAGLATDPTTYAAGIGAARKALATKEAAAIFAPVVARGAYSSTKEAWDSIERGDDLREVSKRVGSAALADAMALFTAFHLVGGEAKPAGGEAPVMAKQEAPGAPPAGPAVETPSAPPAGPPEPAPARPVAPGESLGMSDDLSRLLAAATEAVEGQNLDPAVQGAMSQLPPVPEGYVRLWRWEGAGAVEAGGSGGKSTGRRGWFERSPGAYYTPGTPPEAGRWLDIPEHEFTRFAADPNATEVLLPEGIAARAEPLIPSAGQVPFELVDPSAPPPAPTEPLPFAPRAEVPPAPGAPPGAPTAGPETAGALALEPGRAELPPPPAAGGPPGQPSPYDPPDLTSPQLRQPIHRAVTEAAGDVMTEAGIPHDPARLISDELVEHINAGRIPLPDLQASLAARGLSLVDFTSSLFRPAVKDAAQRLQALSALSQRLTRLAKSNPELAGQVEALGEFGSAIDEAAHAQSWWRRLDNVRRGLLVTQISTSMRNVETQGMRAALLMPEQALDAALLGAVRGLGVQIGNAPHPLDGFRVIGDMLLSIGQRGRYARTTEFLDTVLSAHPQKWTNKLFGTFASDISTEVANSGVVHQGADAVFNHVERGVQFLNTLNRGQEFFFRRSIMKAALLQDLHQRGIHDYEGIIREAQAAEKIGDTEALAAAQEKIAELIPEDVVSRGVQNALELTFAENPKWGTAGHAFLQAINKIPGLTLVLPFPRFLVNSLKFYADYSPLGFLKFAAGGAKEGIGRGGEAAIKAATGKEVKLWGNSKEIQKLVSGDPSTLSKAMIGSALFLTAYQIRNSDEAGERWYEYRVPDSVPKIGGRTIDLRPFNPFAAYLFAADVTKRWREGSLATLSSKDIAEGVLSTNLRAGTGLAFLDAVFKQATSLGSPEDVVRMFEGFGGEYIAGYMTPFQILSDITAEFDESQQVQRERRTDPWSPVETRFGFAGGGQSLPERESPTREAAPRNDFPLLKQLTGLLVADKQNPLEQELARLHFTPQEIYTGTRSPEADILVKKFMGQLSEESLIPLVQSPGYRESDDPTKGVLLANALKVIRRQARAMARASAPEVFEELRRKGLRQRLFEKSQAEQQAEVFGLLDSGPPGPPESPEE